jgi:hypothetical protein
MRIVKHPYLESCGATLPVRTRRNCPLRERFADALHFALRQFGQRAQSIKIYSTFQAAVCVEELVSTLSQDGTNIHPAR